MGTRSPEGETAGAEEGRSPVDRLFLLFALLAVAAVLALAVLRVLTRHPFYDECHHTRLLWYLSTGLEPYADYWCNYPLFGYLATLPVFWLLPESAWSLLGLRFLMLALLAVVALLFAGHGRRVAGSRLLGVLPLLLVGALPPVARFLAEYSIDTFAMLLAVAAMTLFFRRPTPRRLGLAAALCLASVLVMPKYAAPLFFGLLGMGVAVGLATRRVRDGLVPVALGGVAVLVVAVGLYALVGISFPGTLRYGYGVMAEFKLSVEKSPTTLAGAALGLLLRSPGLLVFLLAGLAGFAMTFRGRPLVRSLAPLGLIVGIGSAAGTFGYMVQYVVPLLVVLAFFAPFAVRLFRASLAAGVVRCAAALVVLATAGLALPGALSELDRTPRNVRDTRGAVAEVLGVDWAPPAIEALARTQWLLETIPPGERVVAGPRQHPLFRRDLTYVTADDRPSWQELLPEDDPVRRYFRTDYLVERLRETTPAWISLDELGYGYPPGWKEVLAAYLEAHPDLYRVPDEYPVGHLRVDLAK